MHQPYFGRFGGRFAPETLMEPLLELEQAAAHYLADAGFQAQLSDQLSNYVGRPTALSHAKRLSQHLGGAQIYLKREDLAHTGAHKINNAIGQGLLAQAMGKTQLIAETGAGQHGVATATAAARLGLHATVYMGVVDMERQRLNVERMRFLGADVVAVHFGSQTLKDATSQAMRHWSAHVRDAFYVIGSALGPHPYPTLVRQLQVVIGHEARRQVIAATGRLPDEVIACIGGGSNAIGMFYGFLDDPKVRLTGVEAGGLSISPGQHAARFAGGRPGVLQGAYTYLLQDHDGQILPTHSVAAGLDYPAIGPEHAHLHDSGRAHYVHASDEQAQHAAQLLARYEGIIPALESSHALAYAFERARALPLNALLLVNLSGRGDKDIDQLRKQ